MTHWQGGTYDDALPVKTLYAAEDAVLRAVRRGGRADFFGSTLDLDRCTVRQYTPDQQPLMQGMVSALYERHRNGVRQTPPTVRISRRASTRAWYTASTHSIVLPSQRWALNDMVILHELAHALTQSGMDQRGSHGTAWRQMYTVLVHDVVGPEASLLLQAALDL